MSDTIRLLNSVSAAWFDAAVAVLWQSTVLIFLVALVLHLCKRLPPAIHCWAWRLVALKLLVMPFWAIGVPVLTPAAVPPAASTPAIDTRSASTGQPTASPTDGFPASKAADFEPRATPPRQETNPPLPIAWQSMVAVAYAMIVGLQLGRLVWQRRQLGQLLRTTEPAPNGLAQLVADCSTELGLRRPPDTRTTAAEISPFVCRIFRPLLVLPASLAEAAGLQLRPIVLHELAHIRRRDLAWRLVMEFTRILWWFHPLAHWVAYRESLERELACDQLAMLHANFNAADYARTLIDAASRMAFPSVLRAAAAAHFDGGRPLSTAATQNSVNHFLRSLES